MEALNDVLWRNTNSRHEELRTTVDDDADEFVQLAFCVVVADTLWSATRPTTLAESVISMRRLLCFPCIAANLGNQEINTEWCILVVQEALQLRDLLSKHIWRVSNTADDTETTGVGDRCCEFRARGDVHTCKHDRVVDFQQVCDCCADLLWVFVSIGPQTMLAMWRSSLSLTRGSHDESFDNEDFQFL